MLDREPATRASEPGHHLVGDEQHVVAVADVADALEVPWRRRDGAHGRPDDRFGDEARHVLGAVPADDALELVCAAQAAARAVLAAIRIGRPDLGHVVKHRLIPAAPLGVAAEAARAQAHTVEALPAADHQVLFRFAAGQPVLSGELDRALGHFRAAVEQGDCVQPARRHLGDCLGQALGRLALELCPRHEGNRT